MSDMRIVEYGPVRTVGVRYVGKNEGKEIGTMWERELLPRLKEIERPEGAAMFGVCRCCAEAGEGGFEYLALA